MTPIFSRRFYCLKSRESCWRLWEIGLSAFVGGGLPWALALGAGLMLAGMVVAAEEGSSRDDFLELRVNEPPFMRYLRLEPSGDVEYVRHTWSDVRLFRAGKISAEDQDAFLALVRRRNPFEMKEQYYGSSSGAPEQDPVHARLEVRIGGRRKVIEYSLSQAPAALKGLHHDLITAAHEFPDNPVSGDYLRSYEFDPGRGVLPEGVAVRTLDDCDSPALRAAIRYPGRLIHGGPLGESPDRRCAEDVLENQGFLVRSGHAIHRILILQYDLRGVKK